MSKLRDGYRLPLRRLIAVNLLSKVSDLVLSINGVFAFKYYFLFVYFTLWVRKEIKFGYSCFLGKILHSWYRQSSFLHSATPCARDGLSVSRVQDFAEKALVPKLDSYNIWPDFYEIFRIALQSYKEQLITFWGWSGSLYSLNRESGQWAALAKICAL